MKRSHVLFDVAALVVYLLAANPALTGIPLHEFIGLGAFIVAGVMVSGTVLPSMGLYASGYHFWDPLHAVAAKVMLAALLVHVVVRGPAALAVLRRRKDLCGEGGDCPA